MKGNLIQEKGITRVKFEYGGSSYHFDIHPSINNQLVGLKRTNKAFTIGIKSSYFEEELSLNITIPPNLTFLSEKDFEEQNDDSYFVMNDNFEFYHVDGNLYEQEVPLGTKVHTKEKKAIIPPTGIPTSTIVSTTTTSIPWRKILAGVGVIIILALATLLYKQCSFTVQDDEHLLKFIAEYHNDTDLGNKQALLSKMQFPIASYYKLGELTEVEYTSIIDKYYSYSIDSSKTMLDIAKIKSNSEVISHGDSNPPVMSDYVKVVNAEYPINYVFFKDGKRSEFDITLGVTLLEDKDGKLKIYEIKELGRKKLEPPLPLDTLPVPTEEPPVDKPIPTKPLEKETTDVADGNPQLFDCSVLSLNIGDSCDDGNPDTQGDIVLDDCSCRGVPSSTLFVWYSDIDNDGKGDPASKETTSNKNSPQGGTWVNNADDQCPTRKSTSPTGCPTLDIFINKSPMINTTYTVTGDLEGTVIGDRFSWSSSDLQLSSPSSMSTEIFSKYVGKYRLTVVAKNSKDGFETSASKLISFKTSNEYLSDVFQSLAEYGNTGKTGRTEEILKKKEASLDFLENSILNNSINLNKKVNGEKFNVSYKKLEDQLLSVKRTRQTVVSSINITNISYDSATGKIKTFEYEIN
ncbi:hypothetical protein [Portibacter lacus]|uniref:Uncharacterized protein n=1 Tax=Portibacter lacus TaxID=1099794 RepID=A0AA37SL34_9BACT|nr:hypothetical protein [Portibacter lacus]GLR15887.1 hypothetical protein GCM10007940_05020 [Portibacter lacus]